MTNASRRFGAATLHGASTVATAVAAPATLTIVIPANNEEASIGATIDHCVRAGARLRDAGEVAAVEVVVVSDGSTDRTAEIAAACADAHACVRLIVFEHNRGYGAAIKEGFRQSQSELVAFLDADGTCDPDDFAGMIRALQAEHAIIALGSRLGPASRMPWIRVVGNRFYAFVLAVFSGITVTDTASGMRVIRRTALRDLYPLPDGLHFTPAMSARAVLRGLPIVEVPIRYGDRIGRSKLHLIRDGARFLLTIGDALLLYRPSRFLGIVGALALLLGIAWGWYPVTFYARQSRLEEWMIYRLLLAGLLVTCSFMFVSAGILADAILALVEPRQRQRPVGSSIESARARRWLIAAAGALAAVAVAIAWPGVVQYIRTGSVSAHWSRPLAATFLLQLAVLALTHVTVQKFLSLWQAQLHHDRSATSSREAEP